MKEICKYFYSKTELAKMLKNHELKIYYILSFIETKGNNFRTTPQKAQ